MASSLSEDEFHRMQLQLIELRTAKYELEGGNKKLERELADATEKLSILDKELSKSKQALNKSKKAKDVELLLQESDSLQHKLQSQEEEFRLQNQTLMTELALLVTSNEDLKKQVAATSTENQQGQGKEDSASAEELRRLQAENAALQKNLKALQEKCDKESLSFSPNKDDSPSRPPLSDNPDEDQSLEDSVDGTPFVPSSPSMDHLEKINALQLKLDTEQEEKNLVIEQFEQLKIETRDQTHTLQDELEKSADKLKKKQESYMQLHAEKEKLFKETSGQITQLQEAQERDHKKHAEQMAKLQQQIEKNKMEVEHQHASSEKQTEGLQQRLEMLQREMNKAEVAANQQLHEQSARYAADCDHYRQAIEKLNREKAETERHLQDAQRCAADATRVMEETQAEFDKLKELMQDANKLAENRKALVDELAIKYQKEYDTHRQDVTRLEEKHKEEVDKLQSHIDAHEKTISQLHRQVGVIDELNKRVASLEESKGWLERRFKETEEQLANAQTVHGEEKANLMDQHQVHIEEMKATHSDEIDRAKQERVMAEEEWRVKEEKLQDDLKSLKNKSNDLTQEILDAEDKKKIHEKKGMTMMKDLKRQLHAERRRAEKLQLKLQEVLAEGHNTSMDDLFKSPGSEKNFGDASSVSSWGASASGVGKDSVASGHQSPVSASNSHMGEASIADEYSDLLKRVGVLQQEKWALEEKVNHLEVSNACMADDILKKSSIIETYVMDSRSGRKSSLSPGSHTPSHHPEREEKSGLQKVIDLVNNKTGGGNNTSSNDMNRKLQAMLEETLTKNMHLQQNLDMMSQEVVRLSKVSAATGATGDRQDNIPRRNKHINPVEKNSHDRPSSRLSLDTSDLSSANRSGVISDHIDSANESLPTNSSLNIPSAETSFVPEQSSSLNINEKCLSLNEEIDSEYKTNDESSEQGKQSNESDPTVSQLSPEHVETVQS